MAHTFVVKWSSTYTENKTNTGLLSSGGVHRTRQIKFVVKWRSTEKTACSNSLTNGRVQRVHHPYKISGKW